MIDSNNKLKSLSKSLIESARKIMSEKKADKDLAKLAPPYDKVTHGDVLVGRKVYTHDQVKAHKAKKGIKEDADMVVVNAPVLADINGELAEVLKRDPRDKTVHIQLEGMKYILKKGQYAELDEAVKNPYAVGMTAAMKSGGETPTRIKLTKGWGDGGKSMKSSYGKLTKEEVEDLDEISAKTVDSYREKAYSQQPAGDDGSQLYKKRKAGRDTAFKKLTHGSKVPATNEEFEQIDELSKGTLASYIKKAVPSKRGLEDSSDRLHQKGHGAYTSGATKTSDKMLSLSAKQHDKSIRRGEGINKAADKLAKEEFEQIDELSKDAVTNYANRSFDQSNNILKMRHKDLPKSAMKAAEVAKERRRKGIISAGKRLGQDAMKDISSKAANRVREEVELTQGEIENIEAMLADLDEGRGRPPKEGSAAWKAKQQQDLADMPALSVQIRKASSMNKPVTFMDGKSHEISQHHIDKFHDHMDARKTTQDKGAFQKRAHTSHDEFKKAVSEPVPGHSKDTGEIVKYR